MAAYDYRCRTCDSVFEVRRAITDEAAEVRCPQEHSDVARVWSAVAVGGRDATRSVPVGAARPAAGGCCGGGCCA